jgi:RNA polymerase sigma factor for flagellar operon FliA
MENLEKLWKDYTQDGDLKAREELILRFAPLVKYVVGRLAIGLPPSLQDEDLISFGILGLIEAVDRFDPSYRVKFETYAVTRIRGQIIDSLRSLDLLPRSTRRHNKKIEEAVGHLTQTFGRMPTDSEVADYLNISLEQYHNWLLDTNFIIISLDQPIIFDNGELSTLYDSLEDASMPTPSQQTDDTDLKAELVSAIRALPEREQLMISLYYNDGLTMKEIGQVLGVSESRVSQMHARAMLTLHHSIKNRAEPNTGIYKRNGARVPVFATP